MEFTEEAKKTITAMQDRCTEIGWHYGTDSKEHNEATASLARSLVQMIGLGGRVMKDGDLSLLCVANNGFTYGVNFSPAYVDGKRDELVGTWSVNS